MFFPLLRKSVKTYLLIMVDGEFEVSAVRRDGKTEFVAVKSNAGQPCLLKFDLEAKRIQGIAPSAITKRADGWLEVKISTGHFVIFYANENRKALVKPVEGSVENRNSFGLNDNK